MDGELAGPARSVLEAHLAVCGACRQELEALRALGNRLVTRDPAPGVPEGFGARVLAAARRDAEAVQDAPRRVHASSSGWGQLDRLIHVRAPLWLAGFCTVALALGLGLLLNVAPRAAAGGESRPARVETYGLEWFEPMPPGSIGSAYLELTTPLEAGTDGSR